MNQKKQPCDHEAHCHASNAEAADDGHYDRVPADYEGTVFTCPMHPQVRDTKDSGGPICGMALEPETFQADTPEDTRELESMSRRFWVSALLTLRVFVYALGQLIPRNLFESLFSPLQRSAHNRRCVMRRSVIPSGARSCAVTNRWPTPLATCSTLLFAASVFLTSAVYAQSALPLRIEEAVQIAVDSEPGTEAIRARAEALREESVAAGQLPDPQLRFGVGNFPIESGGFTTEGMTQAQLGIRQAFPAGKSRDLSTRRLEVLAGKMDDAAEARDRDVVTAVRRSWLDTFYWDRAQAVVTETREYFDDLVTVTQSLYAVGQKDQQDVLQAQLALSRLDDRLISINRQRARGRAALGEWIGGAASRPLDSTLPSWSAVPPYETLQDALATHPALAAAAAEVSARKAGIDLAKEQYKPGWAIDLGYGYRDGSLVTGEPRSDFVSLSFVVDLPLFRGNRQDRKLSAALKERRAAEQDREQLMRRLQSQLEAEYARWQDLTRRIDLYQRSILPQAEDRANAALLAYQSQSGDFTDVMRGYIDELETRLAFEQLRVERAQSHAVIANLGGLNP